MLANKYIRWGVHLHIHMGTCEIVTFTYLINLQLQLPHPQLYKGHIVEMSHEGQTLVSNFENIFVAIIVKCWDIETDGLTNGPYFESMLHDTMIL